MNGQLMDAKSMQNKRLKNAGWSLFCCLPDQSYSFLCIDNEMLSSMEHLFVSSIVLSAQWVMLDWALMHQSTFRKHTFAMC